MVETLNAIMIWTGGAIGAMKLLDFLLGARQKRWLTSRAESAWIWLSYQRTGPYIQLMRSPRFQLGMVVLAHVAILFIVLSFLARVHLGWNINATLQLGHPRVYPDQVWVDVFAILLSLVLVSKFVHPRVSNWIGKSVSNAQYFWRCAKALAACFAITFALLLVQYPVIGFHSPAFTLEDPAQIAAAYEGLLGGKVGVYAVHLLSALASAPVLAQLMLVQTVLFLSLYWLCLVSVAALLLYVLRFLLLRISESKDGPVLALSALLVAAGAIAKAALGK